jgi:hypothetical protein
MKKQQLAMLESFNLSHSMITETKNATSDLLVAVDKIIYKQQTFQ